MSLRRFFFSALLFPLLTGCGILYTNVQLPRAYRSATPGEVKAQKNDPAVSAEACNRSVLFLFAWGNGGYAGASMKALQGQPPDAILYDVKADTRAQSFLGLYTKVCTVLTGKIARP